MNGCSSPAPAGCSGARSSTRRRGWATTCCACARAELDITDADATRRALAAARPRRSSTARRTPTSTAPRATGGRRGRQRAGRAATSPPPRREVGAFVVHVSTDYVFDGSKREPWLESDPVAPLGVYGETKLAGEHAVASANPAHAIVRTAWLFGAGGRNFVDTMLALGAQRDEVSVVTDQVGCPTWTGHLAGALVELAERPTRPGIHHIAGGGSCSWNELALEIFERAGIDCRVLPATSEQFARPATRPAYSVLGSQRRDAARAAALAGRRGAVPRDEGGGMKLLVCGGAGFIGSAFVRVRLGSRRRGDGARQAHVRRPAREPRGPGHRLRARRDRGRRPPSPTPCRASTRS